jgi:hypothetical protein
MKEKLEVINRILDKMQLEAEKCKSKCAQCRCIQNCGGIAT